MYIKLKSESTVLYLTEVPTSIGHCIYHGDFWYFQNGQFFSYNNCGNYKFKNQADVEKLIEDMQMAESAGCVLYDVNAKLVELNIELK